MYISRKYKTVTYENRCQIQEMLKNNKSITIMEVAERMNLSIQQFTGKYDVEQMRMVFMMPNMRRSSMKYQ